MSALQSIVKFLAKEIINKSKIFNKFYKASQQQFHQKFPNSHVKNFQDKDMYTY